MTLWMAVTTDELELPIAVADSAPQLARIMGVDARTVYSAVTNYRNRGTKCPYVKVTVSDDWDIEG